MRALSTVLAVLFSFAAVAHSTAQSGALAEFAKRRTRALAENGQRHLQLGSWARDQGLVPQATAEFLLAVEVAEGNNPGAVRVLAIMRSLDERFWTKKRDQPSRRLLQRYRKKAQKAREEDRKQRFRIAEFAHKKKLEKQALAEFRALVSAHDDALEVDDKGRIVLDVGKVPAAIATQLLDDAVEVDARRYVRDEAMAGLPDAADIHECASEQLRVRGTIDPARLADLHALGTALLPQLEQQLGGRPVARVKVFVFATRAEYAAYLGANAIQRFQNASGFADYGAQQAIVCAEGSGADGLRGLFLHELAHLYDYQIVPAVLPSWYVEAVAESLGGRGAFAWQDGELTLGGTMSAERRKALAEGIDGFSLRGLLSSDVGELFTTDVKRAQRFYVEAWGLLEFLRRGAGDGVAARFRVWEDMCRGQAVGAQPRGVQQRRATLDAAEARRLFEVMFGEEMAELERQFVAWVRGE